MRPHWQPGWMLFLLVFFSGLTLTQPTQANKDALTLTVNEGLREHLTFLTDLQDSTGPQTTRTPPTTKDPFQWLRNKRAAILAAWDSMAKAAVLFLVIDTAKLEALLLELADLLEQASTHQLELDTDISALLLQIFETEDPGEALAKMSEE